MGHSRLTRGYWVLCFGCVNFLILSVSYLDQTEDRYANGCVYVLLYPGLFLGYLATLIFTVASLYGIWY